ncbi:MAG: helix-turn-helix transcriptional regulator, partial [Bacillota bacterium]|nr:helix-turn-helix transcriptional regulator [Bacillota bacterium]
MFYSYNSKQFAKEVKNIRLNLKYSQSYVSKITKISIDGLRKIECGSVTPRFETLVKLSELYKVNLIEMMVLYSKIPNLVEAYNNIQFYIDTENVKEIDIAVKDIKASTQKYIDEGIILLEEVMQFINFCEASKLYIKNSKKNLIKSKALVIEALKMTIKNFDMSVIIKNKYNYFEIR